MLANVSEAVETKSNNFSLN